MLKKIKTTLFLLLIDHWIMYGGMEILLQVFLNFALDGDVLQSDLIYPQEESLHYHQMKGRWDPDLVWTREQIEKSLPLPGKKPQSHIP